MRRVLRIQIDALRAISRGAPQPAKHTLALVLDAMRQGKHIVVMRSERTWIDAIPEMRGYPYIRLRHHQNPYFSRAQMTSEQFQRMCAASSSEPVDPQYMQQGVSRAGGRGGREVKARILN